MIEDKEFELVSQSAHFFSGAAIMLAIGYLETRPGWLVIFAAYATLIGIKEFWYDYKYESTEVRGSSLLDFAVQVFGAAVGVFVATR